MLGVVVGVVGEVVVITEQERRNKVFSDKILRSKYKSHSISMKAMSFLVI